MSERPWCGPHDCAPKQCMGRYHGSGIAHLAWAMDNLQTVLTEAAVLGIKIVPRFTSEGRTPPKELPSP